MKVKNEAIRLFLAITALILTAMLANPVNEEFFGSPKDKKVAMKTMKRQKPSLARARRASQ